MEKDSIKAQVLSNGSSHSQSFESNELLAQATEDGAKASLAKLKSVDSLIVSIFAKYLSPTAAIVFKDLIIIAYNSSSGKEISFEVSIPDIKVTNKNFNLARSMYLSMAPIAPSRYIVLVILINLTIVISIEEDGLTKELTHRVIYKDKKVGSRYLILGVECFEGRSVFSLISKPNNALINLSCALNRLKGEIEVMCTEKQLDKGKYQFDRFTQSASSWIVFTEKAANKNIMLDKRTVTIYSLECANNLLNHSFFLMSSEEQLYLITDTEENKKVSVYLYKLLLNASESLFSSELIKVYDVPCESYEKYVLLALNDECFVVNFYATFVVYFYDANTKAFDRSYRFSAENLCLTAQLFSFDCYNDKEDRTHVVLEAYKDKSLLLLDYQLSEKVMESKVAQFKEIDLDIAKRGSIEKEKVVSSGTKGAVGNDKAKTEEGQSDSKEVIANQPKDSQIKEAPKEKKPMWKPPQQQLLQQSQVEQKVEQVIDRRIDSISCRIVSKYANVLKNLELQTRKIEQRQGEFGNCLNDLVKRIKLKEEQMNSGSDKIDDSAKGKGHDEQFEYSIEQSRLVKKEATSSTMTNKCSIGQSPQATEHRVTQQEIGNSESSFNKGSNASIPSFFPKQFQGQGALSQGQGQLNPHVMGLMMNLMGPINQMYNTLLTTVLQNQKPQSSSQPLQQPNKFENPSAVVTPTNYPIGELPYTSSLSTFSNQKKSEQPVPFNPSSSSPQADEQLKDPSPMSRAQQLPYKKGKNAKRYDDDFKAALKKEKKAKQNKMKSYNNFNENKLQEAPNNESNEVKSDDYNNLEDDEGEGN